ncbi:MAG: hypothetical protein OEW60_08820, partial [Thiovulaceae bacterium]|nr:hypothetical protein [Sulfurimonadaceae bacterium]
MNTSSTDPLPISETYLFIRNYWDIIGGLLFSLLAFLFHLEHAVYFSTFFAAIGIAMLSVTVS